MKDLSIEEKARAYDEALSVARETYTTQPMCREQLSKMFPELKESEDDIIIAALKSGINGLLKKEYHLKGIGGISFDRIIAWLEAQGDKDKLIKELGKYKVKYTQEVLEKQIKSISHKDNERLRKTTISFLKHFADKGYENAVECIDWLEAQWEENLDNSAKTCKDEQKPTDKVEPKFKIGDWVVYHRNNSSTEIMSVYDIRDNRYYFNDNVHFSWSIKECDEKCHLWTIQDAKDGDVLATEAFVFIFKAIREDKGVGYYCANENELYEGDDSTFHVANPNSLMGSINNDFTHYTPATKEQRAILFQKMKESGYEWDDEKKMLKKIELKFKVGDKVYALRNRFECTIESVDETTYYGDTTNFDIKDQDEWELVEQKPTWSEEDSPYYDDICEILINLLHSETADVNKEAIQKDLDWLISLRPQNTWKPSDEQMEGLHWVLEFCNTSYHTNVLKELVEQLKKLRDKV